MDPVEELPQRDRLILILRKKVNNGAKAAYAAYNREHSMPPHLLKKKKRPSGSSSRKRQGRTPSMREVKVREVVGSTVPDQGERDSVDQGRQSGRRDRSRMTTVKARWPGQGPGPEGLRELGRESSQ